MTLPLTSWERERLCVHAIVSYQRPCFHRAPNSKRVQWLLVGSRDNGILSLADHLHLPHLADQKPEEGCINHFPGPLHSQDEGLEVEDQTSNFRFADAKVICLKYPSTLDFSWPKYGPTVPETCHRLLFEFCCTGFKKWKLCHVHYLGTFQGCTFIRRSGSCTDINKLRSEET